MKIPRKENVINVDNIAEYILKYLEISVFFPDTKLNTKPPHQKKSKLSLIPLKSIMYNLCKISTKFSKFLILMPESPSM